MAVGRKTGGKNFKPGQCGNPSGRPKVPEDVKAARELNKAGVQLAASKLANMTVTQLRAMIQDPNTPVLEMMFGSVILKCITTGDSGRLELILNRTAGKVVERVEVKTLKKFEDMTDEELTAFVLAAYAGKLPDGGTTQ
jgi:hypothetical protein